MVYITVQRSVIVVSVHALLRLQSLNSNIASGLIRLTQQVRKGRVQLIIMPKAYSEDLRWRAVWLHLIHRFSYAEIAEVLFMCKKSVMRYRIAPNFRGIIFS